MPGILAWPRLGIEPVRWVPAAGSMSKALTSQAKRAAFISMPDAVSRGMVSSTFCSVCIDTDHLPYDAVTGMFLHAPGPSRRLLVVQPAEFRQEQVAVGLREPDRLRVGMTVTSGPALLPEVRKVDPLVKDVGSGPFQIPERLP